MTRRWLAVMMAGLMAVSACTGSSEGESSAPNLEPGQQAVPPKDLPKADDAAKAFAEALGALDVSKVPMQSQASTAQEDLTKIFAGMDGAKPKVTVGPIAYSSEERSAHVKLKYSLSISHEPWTYESEATMKWIDDAWRVVWDPSLVHPELTPKTRMRRIVEVPPREPINDLEGIALVEEVAMFEIGIDKGAAEEAAWAEAARDLASALQIDAAEYEKKVMAGGAKQFVVAATKFQQDIPAQVGEIPGGHVREVKRVVGPSPGFASSVLGSVGKPSAEMIEKSGGKLTPDDVVGLSGLQSRYQDQLGGVPGVRVEIVQRENANEGEKKTVFNQDVSVGAPIAISLDRDLQTKAEEVMSSQSGVASIVAIDLKTGSLAAVANSKDAGDYPHGTAGKYAPGSTFKLVSALAMIRSGDDANSTVNCTPSHKVGGYTFGNYPGYSNTGKIKLKDAIAHSCNTAFTHASKDITGAQLHEAAASLGVGTDYDAGFRSYFGTVDPQNDIDRAASMIGQGQVTMSPMAMAAVAASVAKGETVVPWLVDGKQPKPAGKPLTKDEATELQSMMEAVVNYGTGTSLKGVVKGAKSGTAEFGEAGKLKTHGWMIAYDDKYAVAAFVEEGSSGGTAAAPLIQRLLS